MSNPTHHPDDPYRPGQAWTGGQAPAGQGGYGPPGGYGYPGPNAQPPAPQQPPPFGGYGAPTAGYPQDTAGQWSGYAQQAPTSSGRPAALSAAAALSFLTGTIIGGLGGFVLLVAAVASAARASLSRFGSSLGDISTFGSGDLTTVIVIAVVLLLTALALFWGGIETALARSTALAVGANIVAAVLTLIMVVAGSAWLLILMALPVIAVILVLRAPVRNYVAGRPKVF